MIRFRPRGGPVIDNAQIIRSSGHVLDRKRQMEIDLSGPMIAALKTRAKTLRDERSGIGTPTSYGQALELVAHENGARDWNTLRARVAKPLRLAPGMTVAGRYLGQSFAGHVHAVSLLGALNQMRVTLHFDAPVDVVTFDSFSSMRQRVTAVIGPDGRSAVHTSDGTPHLVLTHAQS